MTDGEKLVRRLIDLHNQGGDVLLDHFDEVFHADFEYMPMTVGVVISPERACYRGREGMRRWYEERAEVFDTGEVQVRSIEPVGDALLVRARSTAKGRMSGVQVEEEIALLYWVRDGKVARGQAFRAREEALEVAGAEA